MRLAAAALAFLWPEAALAQNISTPALITLSAAPAGVYASTDQPNTFNHALNCVVSFSSVAGGYVVTTIQGHDLGTGKYYNIAGTPAMTGGTMMLTLIPGGGPASPLGGISANAYLPQTWRAVMQVLGSTSTSATGSIGCSAMN